MTSHLTELLQSLHKTRRRLLVGSTEHWPEGGCECTLRKEQNSLAVMCECTSEHVNDLWVHIRSFWTLGRWLVSVHQSSAGAWVYGASVPVGCLWGTSGKLWVNIEPGINSWAGDRKYVGETVIQRVDLSKKLRGLQFRLPLNLHTETETCLPLSSHITVCPPVHQAMLPTFYLRNHFSALLSDVLLAAHVMHTSTASFNLFLSRTCNCGHICRCITVKLTARCYTSWQAEKLFASQDEFI